MILHLLIVDDEEDVLESMIPGFIRDLAGRVVTHKSFQSANQRAGGIYPTSGRLNIKVTAHGYQSQKAPKYAYHSPVHLHVHLCCEKGGSFRHALRLLREQFFAVVVSDLRFSEDAVGARAGKFFIEDLARRNPETFGILYSAYQKPEDFPSDRFIRKGAAEDQAGERLLDKITEGISQYFAEASINDFARQLHARGIVYQSDLFGSSLRRIYDCARAHFGLGEETKLIGRHPRPLVLLDGETGTGKTELAAILHATSARRDFPFVAATCNQLTDEQFLRSILFGHVKGAFSGAVADRPGLVETTGKGVLLLDDLHMLRAGASSILHSFLDDGEYSHLGQDEVRRSAHCALVATVETPRWEEVKSKELLPESFIHRVEQMIVRIPPLSARPEDIEHQARHYCSVHARSLGAELELSDEALAWLVDFGFPGGNSRKLRDFLRGVTSRCARVTDVIEVADLEEYAAESRLPLRSASVSTSSPPSATASSKPAKASAEAESDFQQAGGWSGRIARLAVATLLEEWKLEPSEAARIAESLFRSDLPQILESIRSLFASAGRSDSPDVKIVDELVRYYAVYEAGSPAKAAKMLGMKDNALREFIYSREQKRNISDLGDESP